MMTGCVRIEPSGMTRYCEPCFCRLPVYDLSARSIIWMILPMYGDFPVAGALSFEAPLPLEALRGSCTTFAFTRSPVIAEAVNGAGTKRSPCATGLSGRIKPKPLRFRRNDPSSSFPGGGSVTSEALPERALPSEIRFCSSAVNWSSSSGWMSSAVAISWMSLGW